MIDEELSRLHSDIFAHLAAATPAAIAEAARLCALLPDAAPGRQSANDEILLSTGLALELAAEYDQALALYRRLADCEPSHPGYRSNAAFRYGLIHELRGDRATGKAFYEFALAITTLPVVARGARRQLAGLLLAEGLHAEAIGHFDILIADPELEPAPLLACRLLRLVALLRSRQFDPAQTEWPAALPPPGSMLDETMIAPWTDAALELEFALHYDLARDFYLALLAMEGLPGHLRANCHYRAGLMSEQLVDWEACSRHYRATVELPPDFPAAQAQAHFHLAELLYLSEDFAAALPHLSSLRFEPELNPRQRMEAQLRCGVCLLRTGKLDEARREFEACRERASGSDSGFDVKSELLLAELFELRKDFAAARECYRRVSHHPCAEPLVKAGAMARLQHIRSA